MGVFSKTFECYQRCKELTRLGRGSRLLRIPAGAWAATAGFRIWLRYKLLRPEMPEPLDGGDGPVVSLTTFPPRMGDLWMTVDLLMRMRPAPAEIVLTLYEGEFPGRRLPESLQPYLERGLDVIWTDANTMPHKKYRQVFERERDGRRRLVVTVDDDSFYAPDTLGRLLELNSRHPGAVCCNIARKMLRDDAGRYRPYSLWLLQTACSGPSADLLALGFGGVLYPFEVYSRPCFYDTQTAVKVALKADDLWLRHCESAEGIGVVTGRYMAIPPEMPFTRRSGLASGNVAGGGNDRVWSTLATLQGGGGGL